MTGDLSLIEALLKGDERAMKEIYTLYRKDVWRFIRFYISENETCSEITDDVFLEVWRSVAKFQGRGTLKSWILGIGRHKALDHLRKRDKAEVPLDDRLDQPSEEDPLTQTIKGEKMELVHNALSKLSEEHRAVILLAFVAGLSYAEIASAMSCPENTVKSRIHYARKQLRSNLMEATHAG